MPITLLKENSDILSGKLVDVFNNCLDQGMFPNRLKSVKAGDNSVKKKHRPVSVLETLSKLFEKLIERTLNRICTTVFI